MTEFETPENTLLCRFSKGEIKSVSIRMSKTTLDMAFGCGEKNTRIIWTLRSHFLHFLIMKLDKIACRSVLYWRIPKQFIFFGKWVLIINLISRVLLKRFYFITLHCIRGSWNVSEWTHDGIGWIVECIVSFQDIILMNRRWGCSHKWKWTFPNVLHESTVRWTPRSC